LIILLAGIAKAQLPDIIPQPVEMKAGLSPQDKFKIDQHTVILISDNTLKPSAQFLADYILKYYKLNLKIVSKQENIKNTSLINLIVNSQLDTNTDKYFISVLKNQINTKSASPKGIFYAIQTIIQLLPLSP